VNSVPFGLSVHHFISSVGADAGFASLIGLALLVLLYFAHARETATLRARADEAGLRVQELEAQLVDLADQVAAIPAEISVRAASPRTAATYGGVQQRVPVGAAASAGIAGSGLPPAAPAGVAAPALAAATRLIPDPDRHPDRLPIQPEPATMAGGANGASRAPVAASAATMQRAVPAPAGAPPRPVGAPPRVGGGQGRPGASQGRPGSGQPRPVAGYPGPGNQPRSVAAQSRPAGPPRSGPPLRPARRRSRTGRVLAILIAATAIVAGAVIAALFVLTGGNGSSTASKSSASASLASHRTRSATAVVPSTVTVSVLNGTDTFQLAGRVATKLVADGYRKGAVANASDSTHATSIVAYTVPADRRDALAVATSLKLPASTVQLVDSSTKSVACSASSLGCNSAVVLTVGRDLAGL
jgi:LytR cell envelope-related transcriptional attenuator